MGGAEGVEKRRREGDQRAAGALKRNSRRREGERERGEKESLEREEKRKENFLGSRALRTQERGEI